RVHEGRGGGHHDRLPRGAPVGGAVRALLVALLRTDDAVEEEEGASGVGGDRGDAAEGRGRNAGPGVAAVGGAVEGVDHVGVEGAVRRRRELAGVAGARASGGNPHGLLRRDRSGQEHGGEEEGTYAHGWEGTRPISTIRSAPVKTKQIAG